MATWDELNKQAGATKVSVSSSWDELNAWAKEEEEKRKKQRESQPVQVQTPEQPKVQEPENRVQAPEQKTGFMSGTRQYFADVKTGFDLKAQEKQDAEMNEQIKLARQWLKSEGVDDSKLSDDQIKAELPKIERDGAFSTFTKDVSSRLFGTDKGSVWDVALQPLVDKLSNTQYMQDVGRGLAERDRQERTGDFEGNVPTTFDYLGEELLQKTSDATNALGVRGMATLIDSGIAQPLNFFTRTAFGTDNVISNTLSDFAEVMYEEGETESSKRMKNMPFTFKGKGADPEFYLNLAESVPLTIMYAYTAGGAFKGFSALGAGGAKLVGLSKFAGYASTIVGGLGSGMVLRGMESASIAEGVYEDKIKNGASEEEALAASRKAFVDASKLVGIDAVQVILAFAPIKFGANSTFGKIVSEGAQLLGSASLEAFEEMYQTKVELEALDQEFNWNDPASLEAGLGGFIMGGLFHVGGKAMQGTPDTSFEDRVIDNLPDDLKDRFTDKSPEERRELLDTLTGENPEAIAEAVLAVENQNVNSVTAAREALRIIQETNEIDRNTVTPDTNVVDFNITDGTGRIEIKQVDEGQYVSRFVADVGNAAAMPDFGYDNVYQTPEAARQAAADAMVEWAEQQRSNASFPKETQMRLEEIVERARESRGEQKLPEPKKEPEPAPQPAPETPIASSENVNKTQFVVNVGKDPMGQREGSEMFFDSLEDAQAFTQEVQEKSGEFLNIEERKPKKAEPKKKKQTKKEPEKKGKKIELWTNLAALKRDNDAETFEIGDTVTFDGKQWEITSKIDSKDGGKYQMTRFEEPKKVLPSSKKKTQKEQVKDVLAEKEEASIQDIANITGILEPNVRRILGVGAKDGTFERVDTGVYRLNVNGKEVAYVMAADAVETLPKLAKQGFKADMVFLDIPYETKAVKGGNRGVNYDFLSVEDFDTVVKAISEIVVDEDAPVIHMYSQAESGMKEMTAYNETLPANGFVPIGKGEWQKTYKNGKPVAFPTRNGSMVTKPEGILVFNKSGKVPESLGDLQFKTVRPKGYQTEKPEEMLKAMIEMTTDEGDVVLDPFAGSGSTGAAATKTGRRSVSIEKNTEVVENITKPRIEEAAKKKVLPSSKKKIAKTALEQERANVQAELDKARKAIEADEMAEAFDAFTAAITQATKFNEKNPRSTMGNFNLDEIRAEQTVVENVIKARNESDATADAELAEALRVQYHGTQTGKELSEAIFNGKVRASKDGVMGAGFYVTPTESGAEYFGKQVQDGNSRRVNGETPTVIAIDMSGLNVKVQDFGKQEYYDFLEENNLSPDQYNDQLQKEGFDALYLVGRGETVIFDPAKVQVVPEEGETELEGVKRGTISKKEMTADVTDSIISRALDEDALGFIRNTSNSGSAVIEVLKEKLDTTINDEYENYAGDTDTQGIILGLDRDQLAAQAYEQGKKIVAESPATETETAPVNENPKTQKLVPTKEKQDNKPLVGKKDLKQLVAAFGGRLELTVEEKHGTKIVSYEEGNSSFTLRIDALGIPNDAMEAGDTFILDSDAIKTAGTYYELEEEAGTHLAEKAQTREEHAREAEVVQEMAQENPAPELPIHVSAEADISYDLVNVANMATSMRPTERLLEIERNDYVNTITNTYNKLQKLAKTDAQRELIPSLLTQYKNKHLELRKAVLNAKSRTASSAVVGGSNFPVAKNRKRMATYEKRVGELLDYDEVFLKRAEKAMKAAQVEAAGGTLAFEKQELEKMETLQASMKEANKIYRDSKLTEEEQIAKVAELPLLSEQLAREQSKEYMGKRGFQSFTLTNFNSKVKRQRAKVEEMERRENMTDAEEIILTSGTTQVVSNPKEDRVQILFEGKPSEEVRTKLKKNGFKWSFKNKAWQRKLTRNGINAAKDLVNELETAQSGDSFGLFRKTKITAYHATKKAWKGNFRMDKIGTQTDGGTIAYGFYFGKKEHRVGLAYGTGTKSQMKKVELTMKKPFILTRDSQLPILKTSKQSSTAYAKALTAYWKKQGYDSIIDRRMGAEEYVVFSPKQIKIIESYPVGGSFDDFIGDKKQQPTEEAKRINGQLRGIQMPELLQLARRMGGKVTVNPDKKEGRRGFHRAGQVNISPELFADPEQAQKTLAHEIGHLNDYLPEMVDARGTLPNRVAGTRKMLVKDFDGSLSERKTRTAIHKELKEASYYWRPLGENPTSKYMKYRNSGSELYADALSMLFVDPARLEQMAPTFYKAFFEYLDNKPTFKKEYFELQDLLFRGENAVLEERHRRITEGYFKAEELEKQKRQMLEDSRSSVWFQVRRDLIDRNAKAYDLEKEANKAGATINPEDSPVYALNELNYVGGQVKYYLNTFIQPAREILENAGIEWVDFGAYLQYKRVAMGDRQDVANPDLHTPETSLAGIEYLKEKYGAEKMQVMETARMNFTLGLKTVLKDAYERGGIYKDSLYEKMNANPAYATFRTLSHIMDSKITAEVHEQIGTVTDIQNPADVTIKKTVEVIRFMERNYAKNKMLTFIREMNKQGKIKDNVVPADTKWSKDKGWFDPVPPTDPSLKLIKVLENGVMKGYYVQKDVAEIFEYQTSQEINAAISALRWANQLPRELFIVLSPAFQTWSLQRDFRRSAKNLYAKDKSKSLLGAHWTMLQEYIKAFPSSYRRAMGKPDQLIQEMEKNSVLAMTFNQVLANKDVDEASVIQSLLEQHNLDSGRNINHPAWKKLLMPYEKFHNAMAVLGDTIAATPKIAVYSKFKKDGNLDKATMDYIRRSIGDPDYQRRGGLYNVSNNFFLFSNAIKEGIRGDVQVMNDPDKEVRFRYWYATALTNIVPKMLMFAAAAGYFGDELEEMYKNVSDYNKTNFDIIPLGINENGETVYIRIPHDDMGRLFSAMIWKSLTAGTNDTPIGGDIADVLSFTAGQLPSMTPVLQVPFSTVPQFLYGNNPYDSFRGRPVLTDQEQAAGGWQRTEPFLRYLYGELGGNTILKIDIRDYNDNEMSTYDKILKIPFLGNVVGRTLQVSNYGALEELRAVEASVQKEEAQQALFRREVVNKYVDEANKAGEVTDDIIANMLGEYYADVPDEEIDGAEAKRLIKRLELQYIRGNSEPAVVAVIDSNTNAQKVAVLKKIGEDMDDAEFSQLLTDLRSAKIISATVIEDLQKEYDKDNSGDN